MTRQHRAAHYTCQTFFHPLHGTVTTAIAASRGHWTPAYVEPIGLQRHAAFLMVDRAWQAALMACAQSRCVQLWPALAFDGGTARNEHAWHRLLITSLGAEWAFYTPSAVPRAPALPAGCALSDYTLSLVVLGSSTCMPRGTVAFKGAMCLDEACSLRRATRQS